MKHYLLIGAGFSYNWGGWLASEAFEFLLGDPAIMRNERLQSLLWKHQAKGGFEAALDELQHGAGAQARADETALRIAISRMFDTMNLAFKSAGLEFGRQAFDHPVRNFLLRFDAIFSLNQDLLLEYCYRGSKDGLVSVDDRSTERDWQFPGMNLAEASSNEPQFPSAAGIWVPAEELAIAKDATPILKLHGSSNWRTSEGSNIMILGGAKARSIATFPVLEWYSQIFRACISQPDARLMIVGYGFRDDHINESLMVGMNSGTKLFVIDPRGADVASSTNSVPPESVGYFLSPFEQIFRKALVGASRRPLSKTFSSDEVERRKIDRFFVH
jgi:hypothetical protein